MKLNQLVHFGQSQAAGKSTAPKASQAGAPAKQGFQNPLAGLKHNLNKPALPHTATGKLDLIG